jgi:hypothetical protein
MAHSLVSRISLGDLTAPPHYQPDWTALLAAVIVLAGLWLWQQSPILAPAAVEAPLGRLAR